MISAVGEIFKEDEEWSKELIQAAVQFAVIGSVTDSNRFRKISEERKKRFAGKFQEELSKARKAIDVDDWLQFHKAVREAIYLTNEIAPL